ncbi:hypothetical protein SAMN05444392_103211 [Seinonella peptonophila]|uniref:Uncharacterized protein n=1 Tax=Seinonella peptonophila TaxID=112248 RepID=A0A1M4WH88_9BACL|nr:hypothetical protein [Seinonella peptonophila]SHE80342.1 hypothetical protein SAMN05444392_103211 [Seinonella peptonophila]
MKCIFYLSDDPTINAYPNKYHYEEVSIIGSRKDTINKLKAKMIAAAAETQGYGSKTVGFNPKGADMKEQDAELERIKNLSDEELDKELGI